MEEKKSVKVSLGTVICICIIILLIIALLGMWYYYNKNDNNEIKQINEYIEDSNTTTRITTEEEVSKSNLNNSFNEGTYSYSNSNTSSMEGNIRNAMMQRKISFSNNKFTANIGDFTIKGDYEILDNKEIKCNIKKSVFNNDSSSKENSLEYGWTIIFNILDDRIKVKEFNCDAEGSELGIELFDTFGEKQEFTKYKDEKFINTWNSKYYYDDKEINENLNEIFGTSVKYGSYLKLLDNNKFEDYVYPVTEGDIHRKGTYTFDNCNKFTLKYDDDTSYKVEIYIVNDNTLVYKDESNMIILSK